MTARDTVDHMFQKFLMFKKVLVRNPETQHVPVKAHNQNINKNISKIFRNFSSRLKNNSH